MNIKYKLYKSTLYIYLSGELDNYSAKPTISSLDKLIEDNLFVKNVVFNLQNLSFMDSTGLGVLLGRYKKLNALNISMFIESPSVQADKIFELSGIYSVIPKY